MIQEKPGVQTQGVDDLYYLIDPALAEERRRDLGGLLMSRRCKKCAARVAKEGKAGTVRQQMRELSKCCAASDDFISPTMPLKEIAFRLLLQAGNKPMSLTDLHYAVTEDWALPTHPMNISVDVMKRILDADYYYSFKAMRVEAKERGKKASRRKK